MSEVWVGVVMKEDVGVNGLKIEFDRMGGGFDGVFGFENDVWDWG